MNLRWEKYKVKLNMFVEIGPLSYFQAKKRSVVLSVMIILVCGLILSLTEANPMRITAPEANAAYTDGSEDNSTVEVETSTEHLEGSTKCAFWV